MSLTTLSAQEALVHLAQFDAVVDARSESEFAHDHLPNALNYPTLKDAERAEVGTLYKQVNAFEARKLGAAYAAANIAQTIREHLRYHPKPWKPLIYCWRGGQRSSALALVLNQIGFDVHLIRGGYKAFRAEMLQDYERLAGELDFRVVCAPTGCGKTRLLQALEEQGAQVLDLEQLANHRSSVLGLVPGTAQPSQKHFDMRVWQVLRTFDPRKPVFVESESKKVGNVSVSTSLMAAMRAAPCIRLVLPLVHRVDLLLQDYDFFVQDPAHFASRLDVLTPLRGREVIDRWKHYVLQSKWREVTEELLMLHYDPSYLEGMQRNFAQYDKASCHALSTHAPWAYAQLAATLLRKSDAMATRSPPAQAACKADKA